MSSSVRPIRLRQRLAAARRQQLEHLLGGLGDPGRHHVRVGVVAQASLGGARVLLVELVRPHHPVDLPAVALGVVVRDRGPEAGDLQHHLGAPVAQEVELVRGQVVLPDGVEDRRADVALVAAEVRLPLAGQRVEVDGLGLLLAVAAALPGVHRPAVAGLVGRVPSLADPPVAVQQQPPGDLRQPAVEEGVGEELVPEDVPAVRLAVEAAGGDAGVVVGGLPRAHLQQVRGVEAQQELDPLLARQLDVAHLPELVPGARVAVERLVEAGIPGRALDRRLQRLADAAVAAAVERDVLLHPHGDPLVQLERQHLLDVVLGLVGAAGDVELLAAAEHPRARRLGDLDARLAGAGLQRDHVDALDPGALRVEVSSLQVAVAGHPLVDHPAVERGHDLDPAGPVPRRQVPADRRLVHAVHADEAAAAQAGLPSRPVAEAQLADHQRVADVVRCAGRRAARRRRGGTARLTRCGA